MHRSEQPLLLAGLHAIVGRRHLLTDPAATTSYRTGFRFGSGPVLAVVIPQDLVALWRVVQACVDADVVVIMQAANTGLTGGSTPDGDYSGRIVVIVSTLALNTIHLIDGGRQALYARRDADSGLGARSFAGADADVAHALCASHVVEGRVRSGRANHRAAGADVSLHDG